MCASFAVSRPDEGIVRRIRSGSNPRNLPSSRTAVLELRAWKSDGLSGSLALPFLAADRLAATPAAAR
jgi:hypothetical protein